MSPFIILAIGIAIVLGMIIIFRINAFIALTTAAIVVSLLAPGDVASKIDRVKNSFGTMAGNIGIVIALAAVIGQCMMDSGAADRIVRAFLKVLGEKRAPMALMGSGFVLAVPVFFDTVFYLLVPLARSLHRKTAKHYLLYVLAISAGGAITHTLVPPTPGPLLMAATLGIDIGLMILVGAMVALPAAVAGIVFSKILDGKMPIPMRSSGDRAEPEVLSDDQLPSLFASLLPILLPVVLISANTIATTIADAERPGRLSESDITNWSALMSGLTADDAGNLTPSAEHLAAKLKAVGVEDLTDSPDEERRAAIVSGLNELLLDRSLYDPAAFEEVLLPKWKAQGIVDDAREGGAEAVAYERMVTFHNLHGKLGARTKPVDIERMNRCLLETKFPVTIANHKWDTPARRATKWTSLLGNANLALLLSTAAAMFVYVRQRKPSKDERAKNIELALMSGGAIILITAAGGAFGAMLDVAKVGDAIKTAFEGSSGNGGMFYLLLGFGIAALFKVAQGSSTTAMIVVSGMLAPVVAGADLPYNTVYLATAIGAGSLIGSWMNDSGFWIFAKMSGLTETEALKTWTPLLVVLGGVSLGATLLLANVMPLL